MRELIPSNPIWYWELGLLLYFNFKIIASGKVREITFAYSKEAYVNEVFKLLSSGFF